LLDVEHRAPFAGAVQFGEDDPGDAGAFRKCLAWEMAFCPVEASSTNSTSWGARWTCLAATRPIFSNSFIKLYFVCRRPAVSTINRSA
jgi:hypothetical protein